MSICYIYIYIYICIYVYNIYIYIEREVLNNANNITVTLRICYYLAKRRAMNIEWPSLPPPRA